MSWQTLTNFIRKRLVKFVSLQVSLQKQDALCSCLSTRNVLLVVFPSIMPVVSWETQSRLRPWLNTKCGYSKLPGGLYTFHGPPAWDSFLSRWIRREIIASMPAQLLYGNYIFFLKIHFTVYISIYAVSWSLFGPHLMQEPRSTLIGRDAAGAEYKRTVKVPGMLLLC